MSEQGESQVRENINNLLTLFDKPGLPKQIAKLLRYKGNVPALKWSLGNQLLVLSEVSEREGEALEYTAENLDARGYKQWAAEGAQVKKGAKACYILAPNMQTVTERFGKKGEKELPIRSKEHAEKYKYTNGIFFWREDEPGLAVTGTKKKQFIAGFRAIPVFHRSDVDGAPELKITEKKVDELSYYKAAEKLGIPVEFREGTGGSYGSFSRKNKDDKGKILLYTDDEFTFYHELAHAVDNHLLKAKGQEGLKPGQQVDQEVIAEFSAAVLAAMAGKDAETAVGSTRDYISMYAKEANMTPQKAVFMFLDRVEEIVMFISTEGKDMGD